MDERVLVVDDDPEIRRLITAYLGEAGYRVREAADGLEALSLLRREGADIVVLDLMLPKADGFEVTRRMRAEPELAAIPIIMLTARIDDTDKVLGLELGADDYLTKPFNPRELAARIKAVLRRSATAGGSRQAETRVLACGGLRLDTERRTAFADDRELELTKTEFALLEALMTNAGYTLTSDELLEKALGYSWEGMGRTLDTHIRNLRRKVEPEPDAPRYIETVHGVGYRLRRQSAAEAAP